MQLEIRFENGSWHLVQTNMITGERITLATFSTAFEAQEAMISKMNQEA